MLTGNLCMVMEPVEGENLDEYLIRSMKNKEVKQRLFEEVKKELENSHAEEVMMKLKYMQDVLGNPDKKYGIHPDENGREALWEIIFSRPANYEKPSFCKRKED